MAKLHPYLMFNGNCREAMEFYAAALGGELTLLRYGDSPEAAHMPAEAHDRIMHSDLAVSNFILMAADSRQGDTPAIGENITLMVDCSSAAEIETMFANLAQGGEITHALQAESWGATFGTLTDRYGIAWMFNHQTNQP
jgi:PhnB protein